MYCNSISQSYHSENTVIKFLNTTPELHAIVRLDLTPKWMLNNPDTPFLPQVRALAQNLVLKIGGKIVARHFVRKPERVNLASSSWCTRQGSNLRPFDSKSNALSN
jgi:hypothetical protein